MSKAALKQYRKLIRATWLPIVGRARFTSYEYELIEEWFNAGIESLVILKAIQRCNERNRRNGTPIFSIGVIKGDLEAVMQEKSRTYVGDSRQVDDNAWREQWRRDLIDLIGLVSEPFLSSYRALLADLDSLSRAEAQSRWTAIQNLKKE